VENASRQSENECVFRVYAVIWISRYDGNFFKVELVTIVEPSGERVSYVEARNAQHPNESDQNGQIERLKGFVTKLPSMEATNPLEPFNQLQRMINTAQSQYGSMGIEFPTNEKRTNEKSEIVYRVRLP
jgi:hypothetical protein